LLIGLCATELFTIYVKKTYQFKTQCKDDVMMSVH